MVCCPLWAGSVLVAPRMSEVDLAGPALSRQSCPCPGCCRGGKRSPTWAAWGGPSRGSVTEPHHRPPHRCHGTPRGTQGPLWNLLVHEHVRTAASLLFSTPHGISSISSPWPTASRQPMASGHMPAAAANTTLLRGSAGFQPDTHTEVHSLRKDFVLTQRPQ